MLADGRIAQLTPMRASDADRLVRFHHTLVADEHQGAGIGRALFDMLATRARTMGITRFVADVLPSDRRMLQLFRRTGLTCERRFEDDVIHLVISLGATMAPCPTPAG